MTQPARYDFQVKRRADYFLRLQIKDALKQPVNLTGYEIVGQVWDQARSVKYADFTVIDDELGAGRVKLSLLPEDTELLPEDSWYDVLIVSPAGVKEYYLEGIIYANEGYTEVP
jgi:hypothetical protein